MKDQNNNIVLALRVLGDGKSCANGTCSTCPADKFRPEGGACDDGTMLAAADRIEFLQSELARVLAEQNAALSDLQSYARTAHTCLHAAYCSWLKTNHDYCMCCPDWMWRGIEDC